MAGSLNKVILIGNVGRDPEISSFSSGDQVAKFSLATSESWRDRATGERKDRTEWHNIVIYNEHLIKIASQYIKKGTKIYVEGQLQTRKWQDPQTNSDRFTTEVVLQKYRGELQMLDRVGNEAQGGYAPNNAPSANENPAFSAPSENFSSSDYDIDDEIPF